MRRAIALPYPLSLGPTFAPLARGRFDPTTRVAGGAVARATRTPEGPVTLYLKATGREIEAHAWGSGAAWALERLPSLLGAEDDPTALVPRHDIVRAASRRLRGLRLLRTGTIVELLVPSIIEQRVAGREAWRSYAALVRRHGEPAPGPLGLLLQPDPATLGSLPSWAYHPLGIERRRAETLRRASTQAPKLERLAGIGAEAARSALKAVAGIGDWTAAEVTRLSHGDPDAVSVGDYHLKNVVAWALAGEARADDDRMLELLEPYRGQRQRVIRLLETAGVRAPSFGPRRPLRSFARL